MTHYRHTQFGTLVVVVIAAVIGLQTLIGALAGWPRFLLPFSALLGLVVLLFHSLTVEVDPGRILLRFGWGPIRKTYPVSTIKAARTVTNSWLYGWGIRWTPHGWLFNISGFDAVEIEFDGGKKVRIGTDEPRELLGAIRRVAPGKLRP